MATFAIRDDSGAYGGGYVEIRAPIEYKPKLATTSTEDSDRTQDLIMHNTPMGTIVGYDMKWGDLKTEEVRKILNLMVNKSSFSMQHYDIFDGWCAKDFYASNFSVDAVRLREYQFNGNVYNEELWSGLTINIRPINPLTGVRA